MKPWITKQYEEWAKENNWLMSGSLEACRDCACAADYMVTLDPKKGPKQLILCCTQHFKAIYPTGQNVYALYHKAGFKKLDEDRRFGNQ